MRFAKCRCRMMRACGTLIRQRNWPSGAAGSGFAWDVAWSAERGLEGRGDPIFLDVRLAGLPRPCGARNDDGKLIAPADHQCPTKMPVVSVRRYIKKMDPRSSPGSSEEHKSELQSLMSISY